jgi:glucokinase
MSEILVADIGGTSSRFAFAAPGKRPGAAVTVSNDAFENVEAAVRYALDGAPVRPAAAVLAVAGPIGGDEIALTNRAWSFRLSVLSEKFGFPFRAINDFEAVAWSLRLLGEDDTHPIGQASANPHGVKIVLGPGTGLGVAALVPVGNSWHAIPGEGGHSSFGPAVRDEESVFARLTEELKFVAAEMLLSGPGLPRLHRAVNPGVIKLSSEMILTQARAGNREARSTIALFVRLLGRFAGDMALIFKATGGVYVAGGVAMGLGNLLDARLFRAAFEMHPPQEKLLAAIPTSLITCGEPGLLGCSAYAAQMAEG